MEREGTKGKIIAHGKKEMQKRERGSSIEEIEKEWKSGENKVRREKGERT